jgi:hypothetical protein
MKEYVPRQALLGVPLRIFVSGSSFRQDGSAPLPLTIEKVNGGYIGFAFDAGNDSCTRYGFA